MARERAAGGGIGRLEQPSITAVEHRGIEYVPRGERWGTPGSLFWMWAGAIWNVEFLVYGCSGSSYSACPSRRRWS